MVKHPGEVRLDEAPRSHVLRLLLAPHHLRLGKARELLDQRPRWEGIKLLYTQQIDVVQPALLTFFVEIVVDLARAEHHALDLRVRLELYRLACKKLSIIPQHPVKARARPELGQSRYRARVTEQRLRRH